MTRRSLFPSPALLLAITAALGAQDAAKPAQSPWHLRSEVSYVRTSGNTRTETFAGKLDASLQKRIHKFFVMGQYLYGRNRGREDSNKLALDGRWEAALNERFSGIVSLGYGRDKFSGFRYRLFLGPGLGYFLVKEARRTLQLSLALNCAYDRFSVGERRDLRSLTGKALAKFDWQALDNLKLLQNLGHVVSFGEAGRYFVESETGLEARINKTFSVGFSYRLNHQNRPPAPEIRKTDTTFLTTLILDIR